MSPSECRYANCDLAPHDLSPYCVGHAACYAYGCPDLRAKTGFYCPMHAEERTPPPCRYSYCFDDQRDDSPYCARHAWCYAPDCADHRASVGVFCAIHAPAPWTGGPGLPHMPETREIPGDTERLPPARLGRGGNLGDRW